MNAVLRALQRSECLLIIDNCEHLVEACAALVDRLLRECAEVSILATSRRALGVDGESVWSVSPLPLPGGDLTGSDEIGRLRRHQ